jgi:hypothetical protein
MILHTFGDSHCWYGGWNTINIPNLTIKCNRMDNPPEGTTMVKFGLQKLNIIDIKKYDVNEGDAVCFCMGEVDCRMHICKPKNFEIYKTLIDEIVNRYFEAIKENVEQYENLITIVFNVVPPVKPYAGVFVGTDEERKEVTLFMNLKLKKYCEKYNYIFFDVYDKYCDEDGLLDRKYSDDHHIRDEIFMKEFLENYFKLKI